MNVTTHKIEVEILLKKHKHLRDDDNKLWANVCFKHCKKLGFKPHEQTAMEFLALLSSGSLPSFESISRCRRKLQEQHPQLRGDKYQERQGEQKKVIEQIKAF
jgi:hypothetical protein